MLREKQRREKGQRGVGTGDQQSGLMENNGTAQIFTINPGARPKHRMISHHKIKHRGVSVRGVLLGEKKNLLKHRE